ncbi:TylF/MycF/NovP-related O-methyltransferase [Noviherbaspirillum aridicola]|uniref:Macrocin O-methyltransferase n=1 Tax=Noviherbaspirillum aridicola TaxID=2849687 RepID=A0ABQ4Q5K7_9BURK|nr:TylF/MycF/NovP-related O-methyltransferase [Noviherbaspirillum aridicola]GIZ52085.1 hypothetical protein NCCP691_20990 [Noviherbaspirillum aridicola]
MISATSYIDQLKHRLTGRDGAQPRPGTGVGLAQCEALLDDAERVFRPYLAASGMSLQSQLGSLASDGRFSAALLQKLLNGMHPDLTPDTMCAPVLVDHVHACVMQVILSQVPGDFIETGVWKGGIPVLMRGILKAYGITDRKVWVADSFQGLPRPDPEKNLDDAIWFHLLGPLDHLRISLDQVRSVFRKYDLLDEQVCFLAGWFGETLPAAPIERLALMRLDGDWYDSTRDALEALYPKLSPGGWVIVDDYGLPFGCRQAVDEYRAAHGITEPLRAVNEQTVCWRKNKPAG